MGKYEKAIALWRSYSLSKPLDVDKYLSSFRILFAFNSGKIENEEVTYHDTREIFENGKVSGYTGSTKALFEQENQKLCYEFLKKRIVDKEPITIELIQEIHRILTSGTYDERRYIENGERPGEFKRHDYVTGIHEVGSLPEDVETDLQDLLEEISEYSDKDTLKVAAYFHVRFEYIHPFADCIGIVGRTQMNYYLMTHNHPPVIVYDEDKSSYYKGLEAYDSDEDVNPMYSFLKRETEKTWARTLERQEIRSRER